MNLRKIFKSVTREKIFRLYFTNPDAEFYLRELERNFNIPVANIRRELIALEHDGIFTRRHKANLLYYRLDKNYPLFSELKSIVAKTIGIEGALRDAFRNLKIDLAFIYGSFAENKERVNSDIDICIVGKTNEKILPRIINKLEKELMREINYTPYTPEEFADKKNKKGNFLNQVLKQKIIVLKGRLDAGKIN
jgi:predicted nucleotidyltransferase